MLEGFAIKQINQTYAILCITCNIRKSLPSKGNYAIMIELLKTFLDLSFIAEPMGKE